LVVMQVVRFYCMKVARLPAAYRGYRLIRTFAFGLVTFFRDERSEVCRITAR
jgi:hypothetical protein